MKNRNSNFSITFEWNSLIKDLIRNCWAIILAAVIAWMGISVAEKSIYTPTYTSSAVLVVRSKSGTTGMYSSLSASSEMATIFSEVFKQPSLKKLAAEHVGMKSFNGTITAEVSGSTNIMNVSVKSTDPETAFKLLCSVLEVYPRVSDFVFTGAVIDVLSSPKMPMSPSNSVLTRYRNHIVLLAMLLVAGLIVLFSLLRETVKEEKGFSDKIDGELIGTISHERAHLSFKERMNRKKRSMLINDAYSSLKFTEDYQRIATKLEYAKKNRNERVFEVISVAENEGKSTIAANTAIALSNRGYRVALLDLDVRKPSMHKIFDFKNEVEADFSDVLSQKVAFDKFSFFRYRKSDLIIAFNKKSHADSSELFRSDVLKNCIGVLREKVDFVIIDTPPSSVSADAITVSNLVDGVLLVIRTDVVPVQDINDAILSVSDAGGKLVGCILNDVYKPFTLFGQMGTDEMGYYGHSTYYKSHSKFNSVPALSDEISGEDFTGGDLDKTSLN